nr:hypothetical protein [Dyella sp. ASV24]
MKRTIVHTLFALGFVLLAGPACELAGSQKLGAMLMPSAHAVIGMPLTPVSYAGVARRTARRTVAVASVATTTAVVATTAAVASTVAVGTMVSMLPAGCASVHSGNATLFQCGGVYYRPAYQGPNVVYVVTTP